MKKIPLCSFYRPQGEFLHILFQADAILAGQGKHRYETIKTGKG